MLGNNSFHNWPRLILKKNNHRLRFLTEVEIDDLLKAYMPHLKPMVETARLTGRRRGHFYA